MKNHCGVPNPVNTTLSVPSHLKAGRPSRRAAINAAWFTKPYHSLWKSRLSIRPAHSETQCRGGHRQPAANPDPFPFVRQGHAVLYKKQIPKKPSLYSTNTQAAANNRAAAAIEKVPIHAYWLSSAVNILPPFLHLYPSDNRPNSGFRLTGNEPHSRFFLIQVPDFPRKPFMKYLLSCLPRWVYPLTECLFTEGDAHTFPQREHTAPSPLPFPFPQRKSAAERSVRAAYRRLGKPASGSKVQGLPVLFHRTPPRLDGVRQWYSGCQSAHPGNNTQ